MKYEMVIGKDFRYNVCRKGVEHILFTDEVAPKEKGVELEDLSNDFDGSVVGWIKDGTYKVSTQTKGQKVIFNEDSSYMFHERIGSYIKSIDFNNIDTSHVTNMRGMFAFCENLEELDLNNFDTSNVTDMNKMMMI